jgi:anti-anti-sigma factor
MFKITTRIESNYYILSLAGEFDVSSCKELNDALEFSSRSFCEHVLIDLKDLKNITTAGQRIMLAYLSRLHNLQMLLLVCQVSPEVHHAFIDSGLDKIITIVPTIQEAKKLAANYK